MSFIRDIILVCTVVVLIFQYLELLKMDEQIKKIQRIIDVDRD